jgi:hypothetical protein
LASSGRPPDAWPLDQIRRTIAGRAVRHSISVILAIRADSEFMQTRFAPVRPRPEPAARTFFRDPGMVTNR